MEKPEQEGIILTKSKIQEEQPGFLKLCLTFKMIAMITKSVEKLILSKLGVN